MKCFLPLLLVLILVVNISACNKQNNSSFEEFQPVTMSFSKDSVNEFMNIIKKMYGNTPYSGYILSEEHCFNVTPKDVAEQTKYKIFKFSDSCASFVMLDNEVFELCQSFGGYGYTNALPCDFDNDGNLDLLVSSSYGSGIHCSQISIFNGETKKSTVLHEELDTDLIVVLSSSKIFTHDENNKSLAFSVWSINLSVTDDNFVNLSYTLQDAIGTIDYLDNSPKFIPYS